MILLRHLTIQKKLILGFGFQLALVASVAAAGVFGLRSVKSSFESAIEHGLLVERLAGNMNSELLEARRAESDFLLRWPVEGFETARRRYVSANAEHIARVRECASELQALRRSREMAAEDDRAAEDLTALQPYVNVYEEDFRAAVDLIGRRASGGGDEPASLPAQIEKRIEDFQSEAIVIEPLVADIASYGRNHAAAEIGAAEAASRRTFPTVTGCFLIAILSGLGFAVLLGRQIRGPLDRLARAAQAFGAGDLSVRAEVLAQDEIGTVAAAFNSMTQQLRRLVVSLEERVAERQRAESALRTSQELLQSIIDASSAVIYVKDLGGRYLLINQRFEVLFHVTMANVVGKTDYDLFPRELADAFRAFDGQVLAAGKTMEAEEVAPHDDGLHTYISIKCPLRDAAGKTYAVCGISTDITERKRVEEQLRQSHKMEAIGRLAGGIAHDFNNLLTVINGYCTVVMEGTQPSDTMYGPLHEIAKAGERAAELTRQLLAYSRSQVLESKVWNLNSIVSEMEPMLRRTIGEDVDLLTVLPPDIGMVKVDRGQVEQIILNLVINAREAMPEGGAITIETGSRVLEGKAQHEAARGPHTMLAISDTGAGMTASVRARIFEPFFTTKPVGKGTGLGLSVVYGIVKQSGASISVYSEPGRGTTLRIYFPLSDHKAVAAADVPEPAADGVAPGTKRILLVEDEEAVRRFASEVLLRQGYSIVEASNGREAQKVLENGDARFDLVITDVIMPEMGGKALSAWLREHLPQTPVLFLSGYTESAATREGLVEAGEALLQKPFGPRELCRRVKERMDR
jgi:PAS domain S-box-containing protein